MEKKGEKRIIAYIPNGMVWDSFLKHIKSVHGKTYGLIGVEVQNALKQYVESYGQTCIQEYENEIDALKMENKLLQGVQDKYDQLHEERLKLQSNHDKLRNKHDHLQERFNKGQKELNVLERETRKLHVVIAKIEKLSFFERVLNRLPEEVKQLNSGESKES